MLDDRETCLARCRASGMPDADVKEFWWIAFEAGSPASMLGSRRWRIKAPMGKEATGIGEVEQAVGSDLTYADLGGDDL